MTCKTAFQKPLRSEFTVLQLDRTEYSPSIIVYLDLYRKIHLITFRFAVFRLLKQEFAVCLDI